MKIAPLLAQFFYSTKRLDIPGIGSFLLEGEPLPAEDKKPELIQGVIFKNDRTIKESPELVAYVSQHTGKIKALASADLESFWEIAIQFLHIGKPFMIEGIGSLSKLQSGGYSFSPGYLSHDKIDPEKQVEEKTQEENFDYKSILYFKKIGGGNWKRPMVIFLFVAGLGAAIWGGYVLSRRTSKVMMANQPEAPPKELVSAFQDSSGLNGIKDSSAQFTSPVKTDSTLFKYVVETAERKRALSRFEFLRSNGLAIKMETKDSLIFDLYFSLKSLPGDTARVRDSLSRFYTPAGKKAYVKF